MRAIAPLAHARGVARFLVALLASSAIVAGLSAPAHAVAPTISVSVSGPGEIIAGETATYSFSATNGGATDAFNLALVLDVPEGIVFTSSSLGTPVIYDATNPPPTPLAAGLVRWVWEDVSDLPASGTFGGSVTVTPAQPPLGTGETSDTDVFPVGSTYSVTGYAYAGGDPTLLPVFNGSTGVGGATAISETGSAGPDGATTDVIALELQKVEVSPESELLRGVHDQTTIYRLTVTNTSEGDTNEEAAAAPADGVRLVDHLPAALEFLGCGTVDNSTVDRDVADAAVNEYSGAASLTGTPAVGADCITPESVDTIIADASDVTEFGLTLGEVYTEIVWDIGDLAAGSTTVLEYAAAVPLFENTVTWDATAPTAASLGQTANLDNNNGPSTRHGEPTGPVDRGAPGPWDGDTWTNWANVFGDYAGVVRTAAPRATTDRDSETIYAMDLSILKGLDGADTEFDVGSIADYTLTLRASEYMHSSDIVVYDTLSNGLCPVLPAGTAYINLSGLDISDCTGITGTVTGAEVVSAEAFADGTWEVIFLPTSATYPAPGSFILAPNETHDITYDALNRGAYELAPSEYGPTTSGDGFGNTADFTALSDGIVELTTLPGGTTDLYDTWFTWDDSGASIGSDLTTISKRVMDREDVVADLGAGVNPCTSGTATWNDDLATGFRMGDTACFELTVNFPFSIDVRNPVVTDFLPDGLTYAGHEVAAASTVPAGEVSLDASGSGSGRLEWTLGALGDGGDYYVDRGEVFVVHLWATVNEPSNGPILDKPENLMKYRQQNVDGDLYFLRDEAAIEIDPELSLIKGVQSVLPNVGPSSSTRPAGSEDFPDGDTFASNRDSIEVAEGEVITYRVDVYGQPYPASGLVVWDLLPTEITKADVPPADISNGGVAYDPGDAGYPAAAGGSRSVIIWSGVAVPYSAIDGESRVSLTYDVVIPTPTLVRTNIDNEASIIQYSADVNTSTTPGAQVYYPTGSLDTSLSGSWNTDGTDTRDDSRVFLPRITVDKTRTSPTDTNNSSTQVVKGEWAEFEVSVTIPAYTTVGNATLRDQVRNDTNGSWVAPSASSYWVFNPAAVTVTHPGGTTAGGATSFTYASQTFTIDTTDGILTFPTSYTNATGTDEVFTIHLEAYVVGTAPWVHGDSSQLRDRTRFQSDTDTQNQNRSVTMREPVPEITKAVNDDSVTAGQTVTYTLTAGNLDGRPDLFDTVVVDCVPVELGSVTLGTPSQGSASITANAADCLTGTRIQWDVGEVVHNADQTLTYTATVSPASAGGATYTNPVTITGYSLASAGSPPDRAEYSDSTNETVTVLGAAFTKGVDSPTATIGEERNYTITATFPANVNFYDAAIIDDVPTTMAIDYSTVSITCTYGGGGDCSGDLPGAGAQLTTSGTLTGWWLGDVASNADSRVVTVTYTAVVLDQVATDDGDSITNTASARWNTANVIVGPPADATYTGNIGSTPDDAVITVVEPDPQIDKQVDSADAITVAPGDTFTYEVTVTNTGNSTAYALTIEDVVPTGVIVNEATISDGGVLTGESATTGGGTITWTWSSLATGAGAAKTFTYDASLADSQYLDGTTLTNVADVEEYFSHPTGTGYDDDERRTYSGPTEDADVTPDFPDPQVTKTPTGATAYIGESHEFVIEVTNDGTSVASAHEVEDTLPADWDYDAGSTLINGVAAADPGIAGQVLTWATLPDLNPTESFTITYTATPDATATWTAANTGANFDHTNDVVVTAEDESGASGNSGGTYTASTDADVQIHEADVTIDKAHTGDPTAGAAFSWTITVTNDGPDPAVGTITVVDTLPADAVFVSVTGTGWSGSETAPGVVTLTHAGPIANGGALPIATVNVTLPDDLAATTDFTNSAAVTARTFDPDTDNNDDDDPASTVVVADVQLTKDSVGGPFYAGGSISWDIVVTNNGPSIAPGPFVVTDTLPGEIDWGTVAATGTGWSCDPVTAGGVLECTWTGTPLAVSGSLPTLTVSGDIPADETGTIFNPAEVSHPTPDTDPDNNDDDDTDPISTSADLSLVKTTVTPDIPANGTGRFRVEVTNNGPSDALVVVVDDTLPAGLTYAGGITSALGDTWDCTVGGSPADLDCELTSNSGTLVNGDSTWFEFDVNADATVTGAVFNTATVSSDTPEPDTSNNTDTSITAPDMIVNKTVSEPIIPRGGELVYTINVESTSYGSTDDVVLTDPIPAELEVTDITIELSVDPTVPDWLGCTHTGADPDGYGGTIECTLDGTLERGRTTPNILVTATVNPTTVPGSILNVATVEWTDPLEAVATVYSDVDDVPVTVRLTDEELAATGPAEIMRDLLVALALLVSGSGLMMLGGRDLRYRPRHLAVESN